MGQELARLKGAHRGDLSIEGVEVNLVQGGVEHMQVEHITLASDGVIVGGLEWAFLGAVDGGSELAQPLAHGGQGGLVLGLNLSIGHGAHVEQ